MQEEVKQLKQDVEKLQKWQTEFDDHLPRGERRLVIESYRDWSKWLKVVAALVGLGLVGGSISIGYVVNWMADRTQEVKNSYESTAKEFETKLESKIAFRLDEDELRLRYTSQGSEQTINRLHAEFADSFAASAASVIANAKLTIRRQEQAADQLAYNTYRPLNLREILLLLEDLENRYADHVSEGRFSPQERLAYMACINSLLDISRGRPQRAWDWLERAKRSSPEFPEAYMIMGHMISAKIHYQGGSDKFGSPEAQTEAKREFCRAVSLLGGPENPKAKLASSRALMLGATLDDCKGNTPKDREVRPIESLIVAEEYIQRHIRFEAADMPDAIDPRLRYHLGMVQYMLSGHYGKENRIAIAEDWRIKGLQNFQKAFQEDPKFIRALNNFIWLATHDCNENIRYPHQKEFTNKEKSAEAHTDSVFRLYLEQLEGHPISTNDYTILSTLGEAYAALVSFGKTGNYPQMSKDAAKARKYSQRAIRLASLTGAPELAPLVERQQDHLVKALDHVKLTE